jgi:hypothetical protein
VGSRRGLLLGERFVRVLRKDLPRGRRFWEEGQKDLLWVGVQQVLLKGLAPLFVVRAIPHRQNLPRSI